MFYIKSHKNSELHCCTLLNPVSMTIFRTVKGSDSPPSVFSWWQLIKMLVFSFLTYIDKTTKNHLQRGRVGICRGFGSWRRENWGSWKTPGRHPFEPSSSSWSWLSWPSWFCSSWPSLPSWSSWPSSWPSSSYHHLHHHNYRNQGAYMLSRVDVWTKLLCNRV